MGSSMHPRLWQKEVRERLERSAPAGMEESIPVVESVVHLLRTSALLQEVSNCLLAPHGLSLAQYNLLVVLYAAPEHRLPMHIIGEQMSVTRTNITKLVDGLERGGWVERKACPADRRVVLATLTPHALSTIAWLLPQKWRNVEALMKYVTEEETVNLTHLLLNVQQSIHQGSIDLMKQQQKETTAS